MAERLRRRPAKPMGCPRVGSNPTGVVWHSLVFCMYHPMSTCCKPSILFGSRCIVWILLWHPSSFVAAPPSTLFPGIPNVLDPSLPAPLPSPPPPPHTSLSLSLSLSLSPSCCSSGALSCVLSVGEVSWRLVILLGLNMIPDHYSCIFALPRGNRHVGRAAKASAC